MTLWASRDGQKVTIHGNNGLGVKIQQSRVSEFTVDEDLGQMRALWGSLGQLIHDVEAEQAATDSAHEAGPGGF